MMATTTDVANPRPVIPKPRKRRKTWGTYVGLTLVAIIFIFPLLFMVVSSLKPSDQVLLDVQSLNAFLPVGDISLDNYDAVFARVPAWRFMANTIIIVVFVVGLGLIVNSMAGFALSRLQWRGRGLVLSILIATLIVPAEATIVPMVWWVSKLPTIEWNGLVPTLTQGWLNSYHVQIVPFIANAFSIFLFTQYFKSIPKELDEAARVDGASWFRIYRSIAVPLAGPAFATVAILTFLPVWNSFLWPIMVVQKEDLRPVQVGVQYFFQLDTAWGEVMAYTTFITIPVLIFFLAFQRKFVASIASAGVKG